MVDMAQCLTRITRRTERSAAAADPAIQPAQEGDAAVDTIQTTLGQALLVLIGLAVLLFTLILLLVEAHYIVRLSRQLVRRLRSSDPNLNGSDSPTADGYTQRSHGDQEAR